MTPEIMLAIALLGSGAGLVIAEIHLPTHGVLGVGGVVAALLGAFLMLAPAEVAAPVLAALAANGWPLALVTSAFGGFGLVAMWAGVRARRLPVLDPLTRLPGARGVAASALTPSGTVQVLNERWSAIADGLPIRPGEEIEVVAREGLTLHVRGVGPLTIRTFERLPSQGEVRPGIRVERTE